MAEIQRKAQIVMDSLNKSVREALEKKRILGQYAVVWRDGKVVRLYGDELSPPPKEH